MSPQNVKLSALLVEEVTGLSLARSPALPLPSAADAVRAGTCLGEAHRAYCDLVSMLGHDRAQRLFAEFLRDCMPRPGEEAHPRSFFAETFDSWPKP